MGLEVVFDDCLGRKQAVLDHKNFVYYIAAIWTFFQLVKPMFLGKNVKFCLRLFWHKMGLEITSDDHRHVVKEKTSPP